MASRAGVERPPATVWVLLGLVVAGLVANLVTVPESAPSGIIALALTAGVVRRSRVAWVLFLVAIGLAVALLGWLALSDRVVLGAAEAAIVVGSIGVQVALLLAPPTLRWVWRRDPATEPAAGPAPSGWAPAPPPWAADPPPAPPAPPAYPPAAFPAPVPPVFPPTAAPPWSAPPMAGASADPPTMASGPTTWPEPETVIPPWATPPGAPPASSPPPGSPLPGRRRTAAIVAGAVTLAIVAASGVTAAVLMRDDDATAAAGGDSDGDVAALAPLPAEPLKIGTLLPQTGDLADLLQESTQAAIQLAVDDVNAAGGVFGKDIDVASENSGQDAAKGSSGDVATPSLARLVEGGAHVIVGPLSSAVARTVREDVVAAGVLQISPSTTSDGLGGDDDAGLFFRTVAPDAAEARVAARTARDDGAQTLRVLTTGDPAEAAMAEAAVETFRAAGGEASTILVSPSAAGADDAISELIAAQPDAALFTSARAVSTEVLQTSAAQALGGGASPALYFIEYSEARGDQLAAGFLDGATTTGPGAFVPDGLETRLIEGDSMLDVASFAAEAYDAVALAALAAQAARSSTGSAIAASMQAVSAGGEKCTSVASCLTGIQAGRDIDYDGVSGPADLDGRGELATATTRVYTIDGEDFVPRGVSRGTPDAPGPVEEIEGSAPDGATDSEALAAAEEAFTSPELFALARPYLEASGAAAECESLEPDSSIGDVEDVSCLLSDDRKLRLTRTGTRADFDDQIPTSEAYPDAREDTWSYASEGSETEGSLVDLVNEDGTAVVYFDQRATLCAVLLFAPDGDDDRDALLEYWTNAGGSSSA